MKLLTELKERSILQVSLVYVAVAWVLVQVAEVFFSCSPSLLWFELRILDPITSSHTAHVLHLVVIEPFNDLTHVAGAIGRASELTPPTNCHTHVVGTIDGTSSPTQRASCHTNVVGTIEWAS